MERAKRHSQIVAGKIFPLDLMLFSTVIIEFFMYQHLLWSSEGAYELYKIGFFLHIFTLTSVRNRNILFLLFLLLVKHINVSVSDRSYVMSPFDIRLLNRRQYIHIKLPLLQCNIATSSFTRLVHLQRKISFIVWSDLM